MTSDYLRRFFYQAASWLPFVSVREDRRQTVSPSKHASRKILIPLVVLIGLLAAGYSAHSVWRFSQIQKYAPRIQALLATNRLELAVLVADEWIGRQPSSAEAYAWRCRARWMGFQFAEATRDLEEAKNLGWPAEVTKLEILLIRAKAGHFSEVEPLLRAVFLSEATIEPELDAALAKGYIERYQFDQALVCLKHWLKISPNDTRPYRWRAEISERLPNKMEDALNDYLKATALDPDHYDAHFKAAQSLLKLSREGDASQYFRRCLELRPGDADALCGLAECKDAEGKQDEATALLDRALTLQPLHPQALVLRARIDLVEGRPDLAIVRLKLAIQRDPLNQVAYYRLALARARLGDNKGSEEAHLAHKRIGQVLEKLQDLRVAVLESPKDVSILEEIVRLFQEHGHDEDAGRWARNLLELDPQNRLAQDVSSRSSTTSRPLTLP